MMMFLTIDIRKGKGLATLFNTIHDLQISNVVTSNFIEIQRSDRLAIFNSGVLN